MGRIGVGIISFGLGLSGIATGGAQAITLKDWQGLSEGFRSGYAWGIAESLVYFSNSEEDQALSAGYRKCFKEKSMNTQAALGLVEAYLQRTPDAAGAPMAANVLRAYIELCKEHIGTPG